MHWLLTSFAEVPSRSKQVMDAAMFCIFGPPLHPEGHLISALLTATNRGTARNNTVSSAVMANN
jgi:hypothetical protein